MNESEYGFFWGIIFNDGYEEYLTKMIPEMFTTQVNRIVFRVCRSLMDSGNEIKDININRLCCGKLKQEDLNTFYMRCAQAQSYNIKSFYLDIVAKFKLRELNKIAKEVMETANEANVDEKIRKLQDIGDMIMGEDKACASANDLVSRYKNTVFSSQSIGIKCGMSEIDDILGGFKKANLILVGARPSVGKSALAMQWIYHIAKSGKHVGYYNLEIPEEEVYKRLIAHVGEIDLSHVMNAPNGTKEEFIRKNEADKIISKLPIKVNTGTYSVADIARTAKYMNFDIIFVDYLQIVEPRRSSSRYEAITDISSDLRKLAKTLKIPIVALCQLNRTYERKNTSSETKEPIMSDLKESGQLEQDANVLLFLWDDEGFKKIKIGKNRNGASGNIFDYVYIGKNLKFVSASQEAREQDKKEEIDFKKFIKASPSFEDIGDSPFE
jgi:replicative DNA helicase